MVVRTNSNIQQFIPFLPALFASPVPSSTLLLSVNMDSTHPNFPKLENAPECGCFNFEEDPFGKVWLPAFEVDSFYEFSNFSSPALPCQTNCYDDFKDLDISGEFALLDDQSSTLVASLYEDSVVDAKPLRAFVGSFGQYYCDNVSNGGSGETLSTIQGECGDSSGSHGETSRSIGRKRTAPLELEEIQKYFDFPISRAAKEMNVGLTLLKKRCRELNIKRWPHRKIKSLKSLIINVKELGLTNEMVMLEEHQRMLEKLPDTELTERTKKLRQACFKANYKKRRSLAACY